MLGVQKPSSCDTAGYVVGINKVMDCKDVRGFMSTCAQCLPFRVGVKSDLWQECDVWEGVFGGG